MNAVKYLQMKKELEKAQKENKFIRDNYCSKEELVRLYAIFRLAITETIGEPELAKVLEAIKDIPYQECLQLFPKETAAMASRLGINKPSGVPHENAIQKAIRKAQTRV